MPALAFRPTFAITVSAIIGAPWVSKAFRSKYASDELTSLTNSDDVAKYQADALGQRPPRLNGDMYPFAPQSPVHKDLARNGPQTLSTGIGFGTPTLPLTPRSPMRGGFAWDGQKSPISVERGTSPVAPQSPMHGGFARDSVQQSPRGTGSAIPIPRFARQSPVHGGDDRGTHTPLSSSNHFTRTPGSADLHPSGKGHGLLTPTGGSGHLTSQFTASPSQSAQQRVEHLPFEHHLLPSSDPFGFRAPQSGSDRETTPRISHLPISHDSLGKHAPDLHPRGAKTPNGLWPPMSPMQSGGKLQSGMLSPQSPLRPKNSDNLESSLLLCEMKDCREIKGGYSNSEYLLKSAARNPLDYRTFKLDDGRKCDALNCWQQLQDAGEV